MGSVNVVWNKHDGSILRLGGNPTNGYNVSVFSNVFLVYWCDFYNAAELDFRGAT
jgi:hypothetical protein